MYGCVLPLGSEELAGVTARETRIGEATVKVTAPITGPAVAWIVVLPMLAPVASPAGVMLATMVLPELQETEFVRFCVLPSPYVPVAVNCCLTPCAIEALTGVTDRETSAKPTVRLVEPLIEPALA